MATAKTREQIDRVIAKHLEDPDFQRGTIRRAVLDLLSSIRLAPEDAVGTAERQLLTDLNIYLARTPGDPDPQGYHDVTK